MLFAKMLLKNKKIHGERIALESDVGFCTYNQLYIYVMYTAKHIAKIGKENDKVLLCSYNSIELVVAYLATVIAGKILLLVDPKYNEELKNIIKEYKVNIYIGDSDFQLKVSNEISTKATFVNVSNLINKAKNIQYNANLEIEKSNPKKPSVIIFTSGTEGLPKGVVNSQYTLLEACKNYVRTCKIDDNDRFLGVTPFFHSYCMGSCMLAGLYSGAYIYTLKSFVPRKVLKLIKEYEITIFQGVPFMYELLVDNRDVSNLKQLRMCITAGGKLRDKIIDQIHTKTGVWVINEYGSSETGTIAINYPPDNNYYTGKSLKGVNIKLINTDKKGIGRLAVKSKGISLGYYNQLPIYGDYYETGDMIQIIDKNRINICGRFNDIVSISGMKVDTKEVEKLILKDTRVKDCLVKKREDSIYGECLEAIVVPINEKLKESDVREFCAKHLAIYKIPSYIIFVKQIEKSSLGKRVLY